MKKISSFRVKKARLFGKMPFALQLVCYYLLIAIWAIALFVFVASLLSHDKAVVYIAGPGFFFATIILLLFNQTITDLSRLPEAIIERARFVVKEYPEMGDIFNPLVEAAEATGETVWLEAELGRFAEIEKNFQATQKEFRVPFPPGS
ncbi:MAG: hypothetical protein QMD77_02150 [Patescibacteria group bacterium]|nr:hypothetical protein [Patescibacteria group bacterium]